MTADRTRTRPEPIVPSQLDLFYQQHRTWITIGLACLVAAAALFFSAKWYMGRKQTRSTTQYMAVISHLRSLDDRAALDRAATGLETLADAGLAPIGFLDLGNLDYYRGDPKGAEEAYRRFISENDGENPLMPLALEGLGYSLEAQGRFKESLEAFVDASKATKKPSITALFSLARLSEKLGKTEDARVYYREFLQLYPGQDVLARVARSRLDRLGTGAKP